MNQEEKWIIEFQESELFKKAGNDSCSEPIDAQDAYLAARKKAQEEIDHLNIFIKEMENTKATIALGEALKEIEKRDRLLSEAVKWIHPDHDNYTTKQAEEWLKQYEEMRLR